MVRKKRKSRIIPSTWKELESLVSRPIARVPSLWLYSLQASLEPMLILSILAVSGSTMTSTTALITEAIVQVTFYHVSSE